MALRQSLDERPPSPQDPLRRPIPRLTIHHVSSASHTEGRTPSSEIGSNFALAREFLADCYYDDAGEEIEFEPNGRHKQFLDREANKLAARIGEAIQGFERALLPEPQDISL